MNVIDALNDIRPEANFLNARDFIEEGLLDSFDIVTLVASLDTKFKVSIPGTDIIPENFRNVEAIESLLLRLENSK